MSKVIDDTARRLRELAVWGVDLSLIQSSLARSPRERLEIMQGRLELIAALKRAAGRPKDLMALPQIEATLLMRGDTEK